MTSTDYSVGGNIMSTVYFDGLIEVEHSQFGLCTCSVEAVGSYYYDPGCMYLRNGDPGYPPEEELTVTDVNIKEVTDENGDILKPEQYDKELSEAIDEALYEEGDWYSDDEEDI